MFQSPCNIDKLWLEPFSRYNNPVTAKIRMISNKPNETRQTDWNEFAESSPPLPTRSHRSRAKWKTNTRRVSLPTVVSVLQDDQRLHELKRAPENRVFRVSYSNYTTVVAIPIQQLSTTQTEKPASSHSIIIVDLVLS